MHKQSLFFLLLTGFLLLFPQEGRADYFMVKPTNDAQVFYSGDHQVQFTGKKAKHPFRVKLIDDQGKPQKGIMVHFKIIDTPPGAQMSCLNDTIVRTDSSGLAQTYFRFGTEPGDYLVMASCNNQGVQGELIYKVRAKPAHWMLLLVIGLVGGLSLFLFGMHMMSEGLQKSAGHQMRSVLKKISTNRFVATGIGAFVTMVIQSSSATIVMLISFVQSRLMKFSNSVAIILGASIGTTITAQIIAFKITDYALLFVALGFGIHFFSKKVALKYIGQGILGFGVLFYGMYLMSESMVPLRTHEPFLHLLATLENPLKGMLVGALLTALIQSSSAFIGILIALAMQGLVSMASVVPLIIGANVGTVITAFLASIGASSEARKVAVAEGLMKLTGVLVVIWWIDDYTGLIKYLSTSFMSDSASVADASLPRMIANAHTLFNLIIAVIILPLIKPFIRLIDWMMPSGDKLKKSQAGEVRYLDDHLLQTPALALSLAKAESVEMAGRVQEMLQLSWLVLYERKAEYLDEIYNKEQQVDELAKAIQKYLVELTRAENTDKRVKETFQILYAVKEWEQIGDVVSTNITGILRKWLQQPLDFSEKGQQELADLYAKTQEQLARATKLFDSFSLEDAKFIKKKNKEYRKYFKASEEKHFERLANKVPESISTTNVHLELTGLLHAVMRHATHIARYVADNEK